MAGENTLIIKINGSAKDFLDELEKVKKSTKDLEKVLTATAKASAAAFAGFAGIIAGVTKAFADYEKALVGVGKTTNIEGKNLQKFGKEFQKLSQEIPISTNELLGIAQAAGQLGVSGEKNLLKFTDTVAKLGVATDLSGEEAATALTRILNVTNEGIDTIDTFGSVIVRLGNNFAATESEIVRVATEVSRSTAVFGVSAQQAAGLSAALKSLGVQAQLGGSAVGRAFRTIDDVIRKGGQPLENLIELTGMTGEALEKTFEEDANAVFTSFINGLAKVDREGGSVSQTLEAFGLKGDEINKVLPVLAKNSELLGDALGQAADEAQRATALNDEAAKAFDTLASTAQLTQNNLINLASNIGEQLAPAVTELLEGVNDLLKDLSNLDKETLSTIASFLKWGAIISGLVAGAATFGLAVIKISGIITALGAAFLPAAVSASAFWVAVTGPIGIAVAGIAAVTAGVIALNSATSQKAEPETLQQINNELDRLAEKRKLLNQPIRLGGDPRAVREIDAQIEKLEELRQAKIKASEDFGTGSLLVRPEADAGGVNLGASAFGIEEQTVPFAPQAQAAGEVQDESVENLKKSEEEKTQILDKETAKRIAKLQQQNEELKAIQKAKNEAETEEEQAFLQRKAEINNEFAAAEQIKNAEERALALENLQIKHEEELAEIEEFELAKQERAAERREEQAALDEELRELEVAKRDLLDAEDREALRKKVDTENEIKKKAALEEANRKIIERNKFKADELKFGTEIATINSFFRKQEVQGAKEGASQLVQLTNSKNATLKGIGKAAARVQAAIATGEGAIKAYSSLAGIPIVGPALGAAAAAALIAFGVEQQQNISAAQTGGFVPPAQGGARDRVPTLLEPNELVVPSAIAPNFIQAAGIPDTQSDQAQGETEGGSGGVMEIVLEDRAGEFISLEQREGQALGTIGDQ